MVRPITTNCKLDDMRKEKESMDYGEYEFGIGENRTIFAGKGGSKKKKCPASKGGTKPCESNNNSEVADHWSKKQRVGHHPNNCTARTALTAAARRMAIATIDYHHDHHHPQILSLLSLYQKFVPPGSVYRTNVPIFHALLRALVMGRLVLEIDVSRLGRYCTNVLLARLTKVRC
jgi:hypothetical protein